MLAKDGLMRGGDFLQFFRGISGWISLLAALALLAAWRRFRRYA
jgi:hypothetical protein